MDWHLLNLIAVMIAAGCFGGLVNYFYSNDEKATIWKSVILGLGASFLVPLFLNMISSSLLVDSKEDPYKIFIFMGFCLIAAISSKAFIGTISDKVMEVAKQAENKAIEAKEQIQKVKEIVDPIANKETEQDYAGEQTTDEIGLFSIESLKDELPDIEAIGEQEKAVLHVFNEGKYTYRTLAGLSQAIGMSSPSTLKLLTELESLGYVGQLNKNNRSLFYLSAQGRKLISTLSGHVK
jgi:Transcriptional regulator